MIDGPVINPTKTTSHRVILPFYIYASLAFVVACLLLVFSSPGAFTGHYFHPEVLAVTHTMALGWGTMMILGASHQLVPVVIEGKLHSNALAILCFFFAGIGMILLVFGFYRFNFGLGTQIGALMILVAFIFYLINLSLSMAHGNYKNVHAVFVLTGTLWMILTISLGVLLVFNFRHNVLSLDSLHYLPLHAHLGILGWFLMIVFGVGSRLIPMFMISKYNNLKRLWTIYYLANGGVFLFYASFLVYPTSALFLLSTLLVVASIVLFIDFCFKSYKARIRKTVDPQVKIALAATILMLLPAIVLGLLFSTSVLSAEFVKLALVYGFLIFFGWISAIIFGMTFKTLPFILWNKKFHIKSGKGKTPNPKDLFSQQIFKVMEWFYGAGFIIFILGILFVNLILLRTGAVLLLITAVLFNMNVFRMVRFKS